MLVSDSLTNSLTHSCLVNLIDVTLACEDANSKLVKVVTVADVDAMKRVDDSLVQIWMSHSRQCPRLSRQLWFRIGYSSLWTKTFPIVGGSGETAPID